MGCFIFLYIFFFSKHVHVVGLGFAQIYLECPLEVSVSRNSKRKLPVPEVSLRRVADALEPPCQDKHQWEQRTLTVKWGTFDTKPSW